MSSIDGIGGNSTIQNHQTDQRPAKQGDDKGGFGNVMSRIADGALAGVSAVAPLLPGGEFISAAADGLREIKGTAPEPMPGAQHEQLDQMFEMQKQSQAFNLQYLQLQNQLQDDNRQFSTLSNLMKVRHDTAKSAINNMHV